MSLFDDASQQIDGLEIHAEFLAGQDADALLSFVEAQPWLSDLTRRVQHYGWKYDYRKRMIDSDSYLGELPPHFEKLAHRIVQLGYMTHVPDQVIVNEYLPGQGITAHIDCEPCFGPEIATLSLGDEYPMVFTHTLTGEKREFRLPVGSLCVMSGEARYKWMHEIAKRKSDALNGVKKHRKRRISITFRKVTVSQ